MGRKSRSNYVAAALEVFDELGVTTLSTKNLVKAAADRGLIDNDVKWVYNHMSRKIRDSELFDTSQRGQVSLAPPVAVTEDVGPELVTPEEVVSDYEEAVEIAESLDEEAVVTIGDDATIV